MSLTLKENRTFITILADGLLHQNVEEGTEGGKWRSYKTSDGTEGKKFEKVYSEIIGKITKIGFQEGKFGVQLQLTIDAGEQNPMVLSTQVAGYYGEDLLKKLPNVDIEKTVKIVPFSFKPTGGDKSKKGVTIYQKNKKGETVKLSNYYYDVETKETINDYPKGKKQAKPFTKNQKDIYFAQCREFLIENTKKIFKLDETTVTEVDPIGDNW